MKQNYAAVLTFWFETLGPKKWWLIDEDVDAQIRQQFQWAHDAACIGELYRWRAEPHGRLAEIIILDQFSRNLYRDSPQAFANDALALVLAQEAVSIGADQQLKPDARHFIYMPYMHSESSIIHAQAVELFQKNDINNSLAFEMEHKMIIDQFGRYPHRNNVLGRKSTPKELEFMQHHKGF